MDELEKDHIVIEGDCLAVMDALIELGIRVDAIITDIPYGTTANSWDAVIPFDEMWIRLNKIKRDEYTPILLFADEPFATNLYLSNKKMYRYRWYWNKNVGTGFLEAAWKPLKTIEEILVFIERPYKLLPSQESWKKNDHIAQFYPQYERGNTKNTNQLAGTTTNNYGNFKTQSEVNQLVKICPNKLGATYANTGHGPAVTISPKLNSFRTDLVDKGINDKHPKNLITFQKLRGNRYQEMHTTEKPVNLLEYLVKSYTKEGQLVLDFTAGSGSLMEACSNTNRRSISIELLPKHIEMIEKRLERLEWLKQLES